MENNTSQPVPPGSIMLYVHGTGYVNARAAASLGMQGEEAYQLHEPEAPPVRPKKQPPPKADNDNPVMTVAEDARDLPVIVDKQSEWAPPSSSAPRGQLFFRYGSDGPAVSWRLNAQSARLTSNRYSGQIANDNVDWPLQKTLKAEGADYHLKLAERYRDLWNAANMPCDLVGREADNLYIVHNANKDGKDKGLKRVKGRKSRVDIAPKRAIPADPDKTKKRAKPIPKKWAGDWPMLNHIDAGRELAAVQSALGFLRQAFEAAVVFGDTLQEVGRNHGVGNEAGAKGAGRALVMLGMECVDDFWRRPARRAAS